MSEKDKMMRRRKGEEEEGKEKSSSFSVRKYLVSLTHSAFTVYKILAKTCRFKVALICQKTGRTGEKRSLEFLPPPSNTTR